MALAKLTLDRMAWLTKLAGRKSSPRLLSVGIDRTADVRREFMPDAANGCAGVARPANKGLGWMIVAVLNAAKLGIDLARTEPRMIVHAFVSDWASVDDLRAMVLADGLAGRVSVRVIDALPLIDLRDYDLVLVDAEHRDWLLRQHCSR
jgi:hypothetical protein